MKKVLSAIIVLILLCSTSCLADSFYGNKTLNAGETAALVFSMFAGDGHTISLGKAADYDEINSRMIFIGNKSLGSDLVVVIRTSDSQAQFWQLELSKTNIITAKLALDEEAPFCFVASYQNDAVKDSTMYIKSLNFVIPYESFMSEAERIMNSLSDVEIAANTGANDPFLSVFPGLEWGMTKEEIFKRYGEDQFVDRDIILIPIQKIDNVQTFFLGITDNKLSGIKIFIQEDKVDYYYDQFKALYGEPIKTSYVGAMTGMPVESSDGDTYVWKTGVSYICMQNTYVFYQPVV